MELGSGRPNEDEHSLDEDVVNAILNGIQPIATFIVLVLDVL